MLTSSPPVVIIANDSVPGSAMPTAAPGLRAFGIAEGLRAHGIETEIMANRGPQSRIWNDDIPIPSQPGTIILPPTKFQDYLEARAPLTVIISNSNQINFLEPSPGIKYIVDFFAPKMLELTYGSGDHDPTDALAQLRERKLRAIEFGDAFIVNGRKKVPYFLAWLLQSGRDIRNTPLEVVNMPMVNHFQDMAPHDKVRFGMAGYLQGWSKPGAWLQTILQYVEREEATLDILIPEHWGHTASHLEDDGIETLLRTPGVSRHGIMTFSEYQMFISQLDIVLDVFDYTLEREYAMVTRTVGALAGGRPVVHPSFTEVTPIIRKFDAGWIVQPDNISQVTSTFDEILANRSDIETKARNARTAWNQTFRPLVATRPLVRVLKSLWQ